MTQRQQLAVTLRNYCKKKKTTSSIYWMKGGCGTYVALLA